MKKYSLQGKALFGYLMPGVLCALFALFVDIRFGITFLVIYLCLPVISLGMAKLAAGRTQLTVTCSDTVTVKNGTIRLLVYISCSLPVSFAYCNIDLLIQNRFAKLENQAFSRILGRNHEEEVTVIYTAALCGPASCGIKQAWITDFLGFCSFAVAAVPDRPAVVNILPDIPQLSANELFRAALVDSVTEEEEELKQTLLNTGGIPGYEHRPYTPGDPLKRINWKLSARRDAFMVRQLEAVAATKLTIVIDSYSSQLLFTREELLQAQLVLEAALGMIRLMVIQELECNVYYRKGNDWSQAVVQEEKDMMRLQFEFSDIAFTGQVSESGRIPAEILTSGGGILIFGLQPDSMVSTQPPGSFTSAHQFIIPQGYTANVAGLWNVDGDMMFVKKA